MQPIAAAAVTQSERSMGGYVDRARRQHGVKPVGLASSLSQLARRHSGRMAHEGRLFHDCVECIRRRHGWRAIGENVGYASSTREVNRLFMRSTDHRRNILCTCFTRVGIGVVRARGRTWVTEIFYRP